MSVGPTTGQLENAQRVIIEETRYTLEHSMPVANLFESMSLPKGAKSKVVPKVGQFEFADLISGVDLEDEQEIGMTTVELTTGEVGAKIILEDKLVRQQDDDVFKIVGRQFGDGGGRKMDRDGIALFAGYSTVMGADNKNLTMQNWAACIANAKSLKMGASLFGVHHPNGVYDIAKSAAVTPSQTYPLPHGFSEDLLKNFYKFTVNQVPIFEDGNIDKISAVDSGYGFIGSRGAAVCLKSKGFDTERERDASLRATELVCTADYGWFELDDSLGAALQYEIGLPATNN